MTRASCSAVYAGDQLAARLNGLLPEPTIRVKNRVDLFSASLIGGSVAYVDVDLLSPLDGDLFDVPIVAVVDCPPSEVLPKLVGSLDNLPWLSHVVFPSLLASNRATTHFHMLQQRLTVGPEKSMFVGDGIGRVALLGQASRREARFERMREFFEKQNVSDRVTVALLEVAEELVMNALYDAPVEAGFFTFPKTRSQDVTLPPHLACEISYGVEDGTAFIRLRDPFGALTRDRLMQVLTRCNAPEVVLDESRGGAGLGLWRVFSIASTVAITVVPGSLTEILVGLNARKLRAHGEQLRAVHLFFTPTADELACCFADNRDLFDHSVSLVRVA